MSLRPSTPKTNREAIEQYFASSRLTVVGTKNLKPGLTHYHLLGIGHTATLYQLCAGYVLLQHMSGFVYKVALIRDAKIVKTYEGYPETGVCMTANFFEGTRFVETLKGAPISDTFIKALDMLETRPVRASLLAQEILDLLKPELQ